MALPPIDLEKSKRTAVFFSGGRPLQWIKKFFLDEPPRPLPQFEVRRRRSTHGSLITPFSHDLKEIEGHSTIKNLSRNQMFYVAAVPVL